MNDTGIVWVRAEAAMRGRRDVEAVEHLRQLIEVVDRIEFEYNEWLAALAGCLHRLGKVQEATLCDAYLRRSFAESALTELGGDSPATEDERGWCGTVGILLDGAGEHRLASDWFEKAGMPVHRAISLERSDEIAGAAAMWGRLRGDERLASEDYIRALVRVNYALCTYRRGERDAQLEIGLAIAAVESVADHFETEGLRERAFDCFQLIARVGMETGTFENVAEGYLNSIRVLRDDGLRIDALRMYYAFVQIAEEFEEHHAAAIVLREASDYCAKARLPYADIFRIRSGEMWLRAADSGLMKGMPSQIVENALVSAAEAFIGVRAFAKTAAVYERLLDLASEPGNLERYRRLRKRLGTSPSDELKPTPAPEHLRQRTEYEETWFVDPAEWEIAGDARMSAAGIIADRRYPDYVRRHALLTTLDLARFKDELGAKRLIQRLHMIRAYPILGVLERLYESGAEDTKVEVARAVGAFRFKRSFTLLAKMLRSDSAELRSSAEGAMSGLFFPHAQDRLREIFEARDLPSPETTRSAALRAIGRVNSVEAVEFICERLRDGDPAYVEQCRTAISRLTNPELAPVLRTQADLVPTVHRIVFVEAASRLSSR